MIQITPQMRIMLAVEPVWISGEASMVLPVAAGKFSKGIRFQDRSLCFAISGGPRSKCSCMMDRGFGFAKSG